MPPVSPECRDGKHRNCDGRTIDEATDQIVPCPCPCHTSPRVSDR